MSKEIHPLEMRIKQALYIPNDPAEEILFDMRYNGALQNYATEFREKIENDQIVPDEVVDWITGYLRENFGYKTLDEYAVGKIKRAN